MTTIAVAPITIWIPARTPSLNTWQRLHWTRRRRAKDDLLALVMAEVCGQRRWRTEPVAGPMALTLRRSYRTRPLDRDNLIGGAKPLVDALVACRWLKDDAERWCAWREPMQVQDARPWTEITLEPIA